MKRNITIQNAAKGEDTCMTGDALTACFEEEYKCRVVITDNFCTDGHLVFEDEYARTMFLLKYSGG